MKTLAISDLHFGAWTGDDLLRHPFALEALGSRLEEVDELVLLGDLFDFLFSTVENAFAAADPFFELVRRQMQGGRVVFLAGNHDHHLMVRALEGIVEERLAGGSSGERGSAPPTFFERFLERRLGGVETAVVYPSYRVGDALLCHGHYLDAHVEGSLASRLMTRTVWTVAGGRPRGGFGVADYEGVIVPLTELLYTVAQLPRGTGTQQTVYEHLGHLGRLLRIAEAPGREAAQLATGLAERARTALRERSARASGKPGSAPAAHEPEDPAAAAAAAELARVVEPRQPAGHALGAYAQVVHNLGWDRESATMVFAHTHQPLDGVAPGGSAPTPGVRYWNTGSWIYEPALGASDSYIAYVENAWPGTGVLIDSEQGEPELVRLLEDLNPLTRARRGEPALDGLGEAAHRYEREVREHALRA